MNTTVKAAISGVLSLALVAPLATSASAVQFSPQAVEPQSVAQSDQGTLNEITPELIAKADPFVRLTGDQFTLLDEADDHLTQEEVDAVLMLMQQMNESIASATPGPGDSKTVYSDHVEFAEFGTADPIPAAKYKEGVTKVKVFWWGIRVWLKRSHLRAAGSGLTVAGYWIPVFIVKAIVATLGFGLANIPGGTRADTNPAIFFNPSIPIKTWNVRWQ